MADIDATPSSSQGTVMVDLRDNVLMARPKRSTVTLTLQRHRQKLNVIKQGGVALPRLPVSHNFDMPDIFKDMVVFDSCSGDSCVIILACDVQC
jgi:hypothetical protein